MRGKSSRMRPDQADAEVGIRRDDRGVYGTASNCLTVAALLRLPEAGSPAQADHQCATRPDDDIVLDFFAGSGTTAHAVMAAERRGRRHTAGSSWCRLDEAASPESEAAKAGYAIDRGHRPGADPAGRRKRRGRRGARLASALDVGFRSLRVDTTNMADVLRTPDETDQQALAGLEDSVKPDRTGEDLLFQVLLDWGLELTMPITVEQIEGHEVFVVEDDALIACFDDEVSPELVRAHRQA